MPPGERSKRTWMAVALLLATVLAVVLLVLHRRRGSLEARATRPSRFDPARPVRRGGGTQSPAATDPGVHPAPWLAEPGAGPYRVAGRVLLDGEPLAQAHVELRGAWFELAGRAHEVRATGARGEFDFGLQPATALVVTAYPPASTDGRAPAVSPVAAGLDLHDPKMADRASHLELELQACEQLVTGTVRDADGGSVPGATVSRLLGLAGKETTFFSAPVDEQGRFRTCARRGRYVVAAEGYGSATFFGHLPPYDRHIVLAPEARIAGVVVDEQGRPVATTVVLMPVGMGPREFRLPDAAGRFQFEGLAPGSYHVLAEGNDYHLDPKALEEPPLTLQAGESREGVRVVAIRCETRLAGHVEADGAPVVGARMDVSDMMPFAFSNTLTQADGSFVMSCLSEEVVGAPLLVQHHEVIAPTHVTRDLLGRDDVLVTVRAPPRITGRVLADGTALVAAEVSLHLVAATEAGEEASPFGRATADHQGRFELPAMNGRFLVVVVDPQCGTEIARRDVTVAGADVDLDIECERPGQLAGLVLDPDGRPAANVRVVLTPRNHRPGLYLLLREPGGAQTTGADGRFSFAALPYGSYELWAHHPREGIASPARWRGALGAEQPEVELGLRLRPPGDALVAGTVWARDGQRAAYATILVSADGQFFPGRADGEGAFEVTGLPAGLVNVKATAHDRTTGTVDDVPTGSRNVKITASEDPFP